MQPPRTVVFCYERECLSQLKCKAEVDLGRPAPFSRDPDSPAFSDPGEPAIAEIISVRLEYLEIVDWIDSDLRKELETRALSVALNELNTLE